MKASFVIVQGLSGPERFIAMVAGKNYSLNVVCFDVAFYNISFALLSTHFASMSLPMSIGVIALTFLSDPSPIIGNACQ